MFVRFPSTPRRLQLSLVETRRIDGKVRHEHIASLGALPEPSELSDRIAYWNSLFDRLRRLDNRLDAAQQNAIFDAINARVPMPTMDEHREFGLANAAADASFWEIHAGHCDITAAEHEKLAAVARQTVEQNKAASVEAKANAAASRKRIADIKPAKEIGPQDEPIDYHRMLEKQFGKRKWRHIRLLGLLSHEQAEEFITDGRRQIERERHEEAQLRKFIKNAPLPEDNLIEAAKLLYPNLRF
jgi:hypothetical protein